MFRPKLNKIQFKKLSLLRKGNLFEFHNSILFNYDNYAE